MDAAKRLSFAELTTTEGSVVWLVPGTVWAIEKSPNENFTVVRTSFEPLMVVESPERVFELMWEALTPEMPGGFGDVGDTFDPKDYRPENPVSLAEMQEQADYHGWEGEGHGDDPTRPFGR